MASVETEVNKKTSRYVDRQALTWVREELERDTAWNSKDYIPKKWDESEVIEKRNFIEISDGFGTDFD